MLDSRSAVLFPIPRLGFQSVKNNEEWKDLCARAAVEQDPEKLAELAEEINRLLQEQRERLKRPTPPPEKQ